MAATSAHAGSAPRVPAWKRLGLKLKYAKDTPTEPQAEKSNIAPSTAPSQIVAETTVKPQKRSLEHQHTDPPTKKPRVEPAKPLSREKPYPGSAPKTKTAGQQVWNDEDRSGIPGPTGVFKAPGQAAKRIVFDDDDSPKAVPNDPVPSKQIRPTHLRKSVSFTPDTKQEDSFSAQNLFKAWAAGEDPAEAITKESTEQPSSPSKVPKEPKAKKEKKTKKAKKAAEASGENLKTDEEADSSSKEVPNYVKYLEQFSEDKSNWKFNKNRQNDLFKHLFDLDLIPSKYDSAVEQYISTTQGQARQRIAHQAEEVLKAIWVRENEGADPMSLDTPEGRRLAYYDALEASITRYKSSGAGRTQYGDEKLKEVMREHEQGRRAELLLQKALEGEVFTDQSATPTSTTARSTNAPTTIPISTTIPRATRVIETQKTAPGKVTTTEVDLRQETTDAKRKRKRKSRTDISSSSESSDSSDSDSSDSSDDSGRDSNSDSDTPSRKKKPFPPKLKATPSKSTLPALFDAAVLDKKFGKPFTYKAAAGS